MPKIAPPDPAYLGPAKWHGGRQELSPLKRVVIHCTVSPCTPGGARATAAYFEHNTSPGSAHYVVDPGEVVQCVGDHTVAYHAPPNSDTIGVELCDPQAGSPARWADANHRAMLARAAELVARLCLAYDLPIKRIGPVRLRLGMRGICGHVDVSQTWHQSDHTDPGVGFPWDDFMGLVQKAAKDLLAPPPAPAPPAPVKAPTKAPAKDPATPEPVRMHLVTSNIKNDPDLPRDQVRHDMAAVSQLGGVILWQEVAEPDDWADLQATLPAEEWTHLHLTDECPISFRHAYWDLVDQGQEQLHGGLAHVSPHRVVTWAKLARKGRPEVPPVAVVNTHLVQGAFTDPGQAEEAWRLAAWNASHDKIAELVARFLAEGTSVVGGGDFNRPGTWPAFGPGCRWLLHGGLDHLYASDAPGGARVQLDSVGLLSTAVLFTDHSARLADLTLLPAAK